VKARRYAGIRARPDTPAERARIDALARKADERWELERAARGRMTDADARRVAAEHGWAVRRDHGCDRSPAGRAVRIRVSCEVWTVVRRYTIPGLGSGQSLDEGVYGRTWEEAFKLARCRVKLRELNRRGERRAAR
jgi:hypothetical protein